MSKINQQITQAIRSLVQNNLEVSTATVRAKVDASITLPQIINAVKDFRSNPDAFIQNEKGQENAKSIEDHTTSIQSAAKLTDFEHEILQKLDQIISLYSSLEQRLSALEIAVDGNKTPK